MSSKKKTKKPPAPRRPRNLRLGPKDFTLFRKLPSEIRLEIYKLTLPPAQLITITSEKKVDKDTNLYYFEVGALYQVPTLLHVCKESREFAEKYYSIQLQDNLGGNGVWMSSNDVIFFENDDTFFAFFDSDGSIPKTTLTCKLPAIAFKEWLWGSDPTVQVLFKMGQPADIYQLRYNGSPSIWNVGFENNLSTIWDWEAKMLGYDYLRPNVHTITFKKMREVLEQCQLPTLIPRPETS
ncbi:uncharacterized protein LY89DRAFT_737426 [Mollisia scopiformis]|uniref:2EXR domain-containing protein n=1 Tax=Mollisia scopiformis TaxID=149040 RepID=A0A194X0Q6_MOLSC|nr:uncharacterized protein LY89DRAFT_737426 [Mollisia scopiformis]KUJ13447.1 hypothetical protein LY89DRAFT_737426 [Mollisia scopiformis]